MTTAGGMWPQDLYRAARRFQRSHRRYRRLGNSTLGRQLDIAEGADASTYWLVAILNASAGWLFDDLPDSLPSQNAVDAARVNVRSKYSAGADERWNIGAVGAVGHVDGYALPAHVLNEYYAGLSTWFRGEINRSVNLDRRSKAIIRSRANRIMASALCSITQAVSSKRGRMQVRVDHKMLAVAARPRSAGA